MTLEARLVALVQNLGADFKSLSVGKLDISALARIIDADGKILPEILPDLSAVTPYVVADEAAMLALPAEDVSLAIRLDGGCFILMALPASSRDNWRELAVPTDVVSSFLGRRGNVQPNYGDYTAGQITLPVGLSALGDTVSDALVYLFTHGVGSANTPAAPAALATNPSDPTSVTPGSTATLGGKYPSFLPFTKTLSPLPGKFSPFNPIFQL